MYTKDLSRKVKSAKKERALNGLFIAAQAPYLNMDSLSIKKYLLLLSFLDNYIITRGISIFIY